MEPESSSRYRTFVNMGSQKSDTGPYPDPD
jgi:hypothetical protein